MSRAGEKLYGDWRRDCDDFAARAPERRREGMRIPLLHLALLAFGGSALFGCG